MKLLQFSRFTLAAALASMLAACSSGGSSDAAGPQPSQYTVTTALSGSGSVQPASLTLAEGATANFALTPDAGFAVASANGCNGRLTGSTYTIDPVISDCVITIDFAPTGEILAPTAPSPKLSFVPTKALRFTWLDGAGETSYRLFESLGDGSGYVDVAEIAADTTTYDHVAFLPTRVNASYILQACNSTGCSDSSPLYVERGLNAATGYFKAAVEGTNTAGWSVALSADGQTMAMGAPDDSSPTTGINNGYGKSAVPAPSSGAVYVFSIINGKWAQQAYIKASNAEAEDVFGSSVALSADGNTLIVGATGEASAATGVNGEQRNEAAPRSGAAYVFTRSANRWTQQAYLKSSNAAAGDLFGHSVTVSNNGDTIAVGAYGKDSAYVFSRSGSRWAQEALIQAGNREFEDYFGHSVSLSGDGTTLAVGAFREAGDGRANNNNTPESGAAYVYSRSGSSWTQQAYLKAARPRINSHFGWSLALSGDGSRLAVGAPGESSGATGVDGDETDSSAIGSGAAYVFARAGSDWLQQAYVKASNPAENARFGQSIALNADGERLAVGAELEATDAFGIHTDPPAASVNAQGRGGAYVFGRDGREWREQAFLKAPLAHDAGRFGASIALAGDGSTLAIGAYRETSGATGINGDATEPFTEANVGAVYLY